MSGRTYRLIKRPKSSQCYILDSETHRSFFYRLYRYLLLREITIGSVNVKTVHRLRALHDEQC